jgi:type VI secretion system secreted protein Hcp
MSVHLVVLRPRVLALLLAAALLAALAIAALTPRTGPLSAGAATAGVVHIEMKITGQKSGVFKGDSPQKGHEDEILVSSYQFEVISPRDPASGLPTGKRQYQPLHVTKALNQSSPQVLNAVANNENLSKVVIDFWATSRSGKESIYYRVTLTNANISSVKQYSAGQTVNEDIAFTFQKITQESLTGNTTFTDDWNSPVV